MEKMFIQITIFKNENFRETTLLSNGAIVVPFAQMFVPLLAPFNFQNPPGEGGEIPPIITLSIRKLIPVGSHCRPYVWNWVAKEPFDNNLKLYSVFKKCWQFSQYMQSIPYLVHLVVVYLSFVVLTPQWSVEFARWFPLVIPSQTYFSLPRISTISISPEAGHVP